MSIHQINDVNVAFYQRTDHEQHVTWQNAYDAGAYARLYRTAPLAGNPYADKVLRDGWYKGWMQEDLALLTGASATIDMEMPVRKGK
jgi:hypothetical protein